MANLATRFQFKSIVPVNANVSDAMIDAMLPVASAAVCDWLHRSLVAATYKNWFTLDGDYKGNVFLTEWPVSQVYAATGLITVGTIFYTTPGISNYAMVSSDLTGMNLSYMDAHGVIITTSLLYATYPTVGELVTAIQNVTGWKVYYSAGAWAANPSRFIKPIASQMAVQGVIFDIAHWIACKTVIIDEYCLELSGNLGRWVYVEWLAGYTLPVDDIGHTMVTPGNLPDAITLATINTTREYLTLQSTNGGMIKSESLGDYSYEIASIPPIELNKVIERQAPLLNRYKRIGWVG